MMLAPHYYNEHDNKVADWLRELIADGLIPKGEVDERGIEEVQPADLMGFVQCHFFAGIGGWSRALQLAGWPEDRPVWTGSCPCQPFSVAGKRNGAADKRHLWPEFYRLIRECKPPVIFGEQVSGAIGHGWLDGVSADLEAEGYAVGAIVLGAHSLGAPHIRQRLWWVGGHNECAIRGIQEAENGSNKEWRQTAMGDEPGVLDSDAACHGRLADGNKPGLQGRDGNFLPERGGERIARENLSSHWSRTVLWPCRDGKWRRVPCWVEQSSMHGHDRCQQQVEGEGPLAGSNGKPGRSNEGSGLGNAASEFIRHEAEQDGRNNAGGTSDACGIPDAELGRRQQQQGEKSAGVQRCEAEQEERLFPACGHCPGEYDHARHDRLEAEPVFQRMVDGLPDGVDTSRPEGAFPLAEAVEGRTTLLKGYGNAIVPQVGAVVVRAFMDIDREGKPW